MVFGCAVAIRQRFARSLMIALVLGLVLSPVTARAEERVALVVGNAAYPIQVGPLANPVKDATLIADALAAQHFAVTRAVNLDRAHLLAAVDAYAHRLAAAGPAAIGFVYYSGHGAANPDNNRNYLIPVDAQNAADTALWYQSVPLQDVIDTISRIAPQAVSVVVFDACREALRLPGGKGLGNAGKGLQREVARASLLIAFSTSPDAIAADADRTAQTGPYATELAAALAKPGLDLETLFSEVKYGVLERTGQTQLPYFEDGLRARVVLNGTVTQQAERSGLVPLPEKPTARPAAATDPYARWGLTERDFGLLESKQLLLRVGASERFSQLLNAAEAGDPIAQTLEGLTYDADGCAYDLSGNILAGIGYGAAQNYTEALRWLRKAAASGNGRAMNAIGYMYEQGHGVGQDYGEALRWYRKAADLSEPVAINNIGYLYGAGHGVSQDYGEAMRWYRKAAELGDAQAMHNIGVLYDAGHGVSQDYSEALRWYRKAVELGDPYAMYNIGVQYNAGHGVSQDYSEAMRWYRKASDLGEPHAMNNIGFLYEQGQGVTQDYAEARRWYEIGAALGNEDAKQNLARLKAAGH